MKSRKKIKLKLIVIFISAVSAVLILLSFVYSYSSHKAMKSLAKYAFEIDTENNEILTDEMFFQITKGIALEWSYGFENAAKLVDMLANVVHEQLTGRNDSIVYKKWNLNLTKYENKNFFVDSSQKRLTIVYWGNEYKVPKNVIKQLKSLLPIENVLAGITNLYPNFIYSTYFHSIDEYIIGFPKRENYFGSVEDGSIYNQYYPYSRFHKQISDKNKKIFYPCLFQKPYVDIPGKVLMGVQLGLYDNGKFIGYVGIDIDFKKIKEAMISNPLSIKRKLKNKIYPIQNYLFLLDSNGYIISFPTKLADLISLPARHKYLLDYLERKSVKFTDSKNPKIVAFGNEILKNDSGIKNIVINNIDYLVAYQKIKETGWILGNVMRKKGLLSSTLKTKSLIQNSVKKLSIKYLWITIVFLIISFFVLYFLFRYFLFSPIKKIRNGIKKMGEEEFIINLKEEGAAEIAELSTTFNYFSRELRHYMKDLKNETAARQAIETEIELAQDIQNSILPCSHLFPTKGAFELSAKINAAKNISGDFFDFFYITEEKLAIIIGDVSGKGIPAAFFMAISKSHIKRSCLAEPELLPGEILEKVNKVLCMDNEAQMFTTLTLVFYNIKDGTITYSNAGHHDSQIVRNKDFLKLNRFFSIALGILEEAVYKTNYGKMEIGDTGLLYTDGAFEAVSPNGEEFGEKRLNDLILKDINLSTEEICKNIIDSVEKYECKNRFDDITVVVFRRLK
ncbi:MAG: SpoIIE family protein phosphatase [bacterium]|nr:SpoIIE family protein phosphatase [bacterium]